MTDAADPLDMIAAHQFVQLTTYRRDGRPVPSPVWVARAGDELVVITNDEVGKVKRLRRGGPVTLRPCDIRGRVAADSPTWHGRARLSASPAELTIVRDAINAKYWQARVGSVVQTLVSKVRPMTPRRGIFITLE